MSKPDIEVALITANVAAVFDNVDLLDEWSRKVANNVMTYEKKPLFVALHCQEVGGKNFASSQAHDRLERFTDILETRFNYLQFFSTFGYIDPLRDDPNFTGLASFYFVHDSILKEVEMWDFKNSRFTPAFMGKHVSRNVDLDEIDFVKKYKFPTCFFETFSTHGFLRTKWRLHKKQDPIEFVNVRLTSDESNFIAMKKFPSNYTKNRVTALKDFFRELCGDDSEVRRLKGAFFIFGDFNFRLDTGGAVRMLTENCERDETRDASGNLIRQEYYKIPESGNATGPRDKKLTIENNLFKIHPAPHHTPSICSLFCSTCQVGRTELLAHDKELQLFNEDASHEKLLEHGITMFPSYSYSMEESKGNWFGETRCPAWCDRVLFNEEASKLFKNIVAYELIGQEVTMGEHKPVVLYMRIGEGGKTPKRFISEKSEDDRKKEKGCVLS